AATPSCGNEVASCTRPSATRPVPTCSRLPPTSRVLRATRRTRGWPEACSLHSAGSGNGCGRPTGGRVTERTRSSVLNYWNLRRLGCGRDGRFALGREPATTQNAAAFAFGSTAPDAMFDSILQRVLEAFGAHLARL